jgi:hypothetical protein
VQRDGLYLIVGRRGDCDLVLDHPSVSGHHARLAWRGARIAVEDMGSANGTFVDGQRIERAEVRPGTDVRFGGAALDWSDRRLRPFLRRGARGDTLLGVSLPGGRRFVCGSCGSRGLMPPGFTTGELRCGRCQVVLRVGPPPRRSWLPSGALAAATLLLVGVAVAVVSSEPGQEGLTLVAERLGIEGLRDGRPTHSAEERSIRRSIAPRVAEALDVAHPVTRNTAVRIAAGEEGVFRVEQVAQIWTHVRGRWRYVNDPRGDEFFASASQTIENDYAGDCDDFAITLSAMIESIGGRSRIVMLDGDQGGHAYAEVCVPESSETVARRLSRYYQRHWDRYLGRQRLSNIHFRSSGDCPVWLNLDWNARVPGGPYGNELWAVAIYADGSTETLAPAGQPTVAGSGAEGGRVTAGALPR